MNSKWSTRFSLTGKTALVTGASKGIGCEICRVFADAGCSILATARDSNALKNLENEIKRIHSKISFASYILDLQDSNAIKKTIHTVLQEHTNIDILVNSAGIALIDPILKLSEEAWDETLQVNLKAPFLIAKLLAGQMIQRRSGKIINIASQTGGKVALEDHSAYAASKGGLRALTQVMMAEWARHNIQVNSISPTVILTPMAEKVWGKKSKSQPMLEKIPAGRFGQPVEVADLALYLGSEASNLMNGENLLLDGGYSSV